VNSPSAPTVRLRVSCLLNGRVYRYGEPVPAEDLPPGFRKYVVPENEAPEQDAPSARSLTIRTNQSYRFDSEGYRVARHERKISREIAQLESQAAGQEALEESSQQPLPPEVAQELQDRHDTYIAGAIADAEVRARRGDETQEFLAQQQNDENLANADEVVSPVVYQTGEEQFLPEPVETNNNKLSGSAEPKRMRRRYVRRGALYRRVKDKSVKLKVGERVFVKSGSRYEEIGTIGGAGVLPVSYCTKGENSK
jgi:hypothetical protein